MHWKDVGFFQKWRERQAFCPKTEGDLPMRTLCMFTSTYQGYIPRSGWIINILVIIFSTHVVKLEKEVQLHVN